MSESGRKRRVFWGKELTDKVYAAVAPYYLEMRTADAFLQAQVDVGIPRDRRRHIVSKVEAELKAIYGGKPQSVRIRKQHVIVDDAPQVADTSTAPTPIIRVTGADVSPEDKTPPLPERTHSGLSDASAIASEVTSAAFTMIINAVGSALKQAFKESLTEALTDPRVIGALAEVVRPAIVASAAAIQPNGGNGEAHDDDAHPTVEFARPSDNAEQILAEAAKETDEHNRQRKALPRILVAGLKPNQIQAVRDKFHGRAALRFWESNEAVSMLKRQIPGIDAAVGMVHFMNHSPDHVLQTQAPTYYRAKGGVTSVNRAIERALIVIEAERKGVPVVRKSESVVTAH